MNETKPLVSVLMSVRNDEGNISTAIESILKQTYKNFEFLIIDDFSDDSSFEIINGYQKQDKRIKVYRNTKKIGLTKSLNKLINYSQGEYIARQDSDDISRKNRIELQLKILEGNKLDACTTRAVRKNSSKKIPGKSFFIPKKISIKYKNPFIHGTLLISRKAIDELGHYDERFFYSQDYKLFSDLLKRGLKIKSINSVLYELNTCNNISTNFSTEQKYYADCVKKNIIPDERYLD
tara:strand:- start:1584 stop:2291 length:708 start_codon:yes stop_codon:yes gene_type:complete